ncbi:MAG TPA: DUF6152 family protein [Bryobacteraceae bacterium]|jgi:hypothetical protein|nr:DUF6152 family protein [Bryobacteraceae bacterium]
MRTKISVAAAALGLLLAAAPSWAHHAFAAEFDVNKPLVLKGTVTKMEWINPHAWIHINVKDADGKVTEWMIEAGAPNGLLRRGFTKASLPPGTDVVVEGWQAKDGSNRANGSNITLPDGKKLFVGSSGTGAPFDKESGKN